MQRNGLENPDARFVRDGRRARRVESDSRRRRTAPRRSSEPNGGGGVRRGGAACARPDRRRSATVAVSVLDDGRIAVRAHRTPVPQGCGGLPRHARPHIPKTAGVTCAEVPGQRWPARAGDAGAQRWTDPDGGRVRGLGGVGEKGNEGGAAHRGRRGRAVAAWAGKAMGHRRGIRRPIVPHPRRRMSRAVFGSGHCLQSRISHDSFLVGYDWVNRVVGVAIPQSLALAEPDLPEGCREGIRRLYSTTFAAMSRACHDHRSTMRRRCPDRSNRRNASQRLDSQGTGRKRPGMPPGVIARCRDRFACASRPTGGGGALR
jgi:hypothetical protein